MSDSRKTDIPDNLDRITPKPEVGLGARERDNNLVDVDPNKHQKFPDRTSGAVPNKESRNPD